ncbi:DNA primase [Jannaschia sp. EhC01]|nr:DNA primase [Jannaschia sp. EhC01]
MESPARVIACRLAANAEAVCRHYLSNGRRHGQYWIVGNVENAPGHSLYVRLTGPTYGAGAAGKWSDAATGEHGDLLDLIGAAMQITTLKDTLEEARQFLGLPRPPTQTTQSAPAKRGSTTAARRLWRMGQPVEGTLAERYLEKRGLVGMAPTHALRFHPSCFYWRKGHPPLEPPETWPALLAKVTDLDGRLTGLHRTWLDPATALKAPVVPPRKAMGNLLGNGVRMGNVAGIMAAGEGLETILSLRLALPDLAVIAALSANHLSTLNLPKTRLRLYVAVDNDPAGRGATKSLANRTNVQGIEVMPLTPRLGDFNDDLRAFGLDDLRSHLRPQLTPEDAANLLDPISD